MTSDDRPTPRARGLTPTSFLAAAALNTIHEALRTARTRRTGGVPSPSGPARSSRRSPRSCCSAKSAISSPGGNRS
ncbi:hypothetical protein [Streptomyces sp. NPDC058632]|uniref:hypothetical protein n=1 Tax=unclassified Streptomyces TaxID=2593676 RepID=UPI00364D303E